MATLQDIFGNTQEDLAEAPGSPTRVLSSSEPRSGPSLEQNLRSAQQDDTISQMAEVRAAQAQSLDQHMQYRGALEHAQGQVDLRSQDLDIAKKAMGVFDTGAEPSVREYRYKHLVTQLGIDPKSETSKDLWRMIRGLSADSALAVRQNISGQISGSTPGSVVEAFSGVLRGQIDPEELFLATRAQPQDAGRFAASGITPEGSAAPRGSIRDAITSRQSTNVEDAPSLSDPLPGPHVPAPSDNRPVDPSIATALGYDANTSASADILHKHPGLGGLKVEDQQKKAKELGEARAATTDTVKLIDRAIGIVEAEPRAVALSLRFGNLKIADLNPAKTITTVDDAIKTFGRTLLPKGATELIEGNFPGLSDKTDGDTIRSIASRNVELLNTVIGLAYASAKAKDPGGRLSDQDIAIELRNLGWGSGSADLLKASLRNHGAILIDRYNSRIKSETGGVPADVTSDKLVTLNSRANGQFSPQQPSADQTQTPSPSGPSEQRTEALTPAQQAQQSRAKAQSDEDVQQAQRRWNLEQAPVEARLRLEAAQRDIERLDLAKQAAKEARDWREYQKAKAEQAKAERERDKIAAAFAAFGKALGRSGGGSIGGSGGGGGGDQDAGAFKIAPGAASRRAPPTPAPARSGYDYVRRMKASGS